MYVHYASAIYMMQFKGFPILVMYRSLGRLIGLTPPPGWSRAARIQRSTDFRNKRSPTRIGTGAIQAQVDPGLLCWM